MEFDSEESFPQETVNDHVDEAIEDNEVVLFMKGTPMLPQCGYSERAVGLVQKHREKFETVNVLASTDEFRTALERHSGRETIPQAFVDGEFVGGSDVLKRLDERGELEATLQA